MHTIVYNFRFFTRIVSSIEQLYRLETVYIERTKYGVKEELEKREKSRKMRATSILASGLLSSIFEEILKIFLKRNSRIF